MVWLDLWCSEKTWKPQSFETTIWFAVECASNEFLHMWHQHIQGWKRSSQLLQDRAAFGVSFKNKVKVVFPSSPSKNTDCVTAGHSMQAANWMAKFASKTAEVNQLWCSLCSWMKDDLCWDLPAVVQARTSKSVFENSIKSTQWP